MCEFCENIPKTDEEFGKTRRKGAEDIIFYDNERGFCLYGDTGDSGCPYCLDNIKFCPMCGRKLSEENHSDPFRQMLKKVAEEMPAKGECDGKYAFRYGSFGYIEDGLYYIDFSCSNCGKRHEGVLFGNDVTCECGKIIRTGLDEKTEND